MRYFKFLFIVLVAVQIYSCKKSTNTVTSPIVGNWSFSSLADTLFYSPQIRDTTFTKSSYYIGAINFLSDGTVYTSTSFVTSPIVFGNSIYFATTGYNPIFIDTSKYTISNNVITFIPKYGNSYKDSLIILDNNRLILSRFVTPIYKKAWYYTR